MGARRILTLVVCTQIASVAYASPRSDPTTGRAVFTGATEQSATSVTMSPAAMGLVKQLQFYFGAVATLTQTSIDLKENDIDTGASKDAGSANATMFAPGADVALVWPTSDRLRVGVELHIPPPEKQIEDESALRYHTLGGGQTTFGATVGVSFKVTGSLYLGFGVSHETSFLRLKYDRDTALANGRGDGGVDSDCGGSPCGVGNPLAAEHYNIHARTAFVSGSNIKVTVGFMVKIASDVFLALAYHTPPGLGIQSELNGTASIALPPRDGGGQIDTGSTVVVSYPASVDGEFRARLVHQLELHIGGRWEDLSRFSAYDVRVYGSNVIPNGIPEWQLRARGLHDSFAFWGGLEQIDTGDLIRFGARLGVETSSLTANRTSPMNVYPLALTADVGVQFRFTPGSERRFQISYGLSYFPEVSVGNSAYDARDRLACLDNGTDYSSAACQATRAGYAIGSAAGTYDKLEHALRIGFVYDWR
ncbi:MAG TPA: outer membrane protein transport protein [Kofleriaceae bacterium]